MAAGKAHVDVVERRLRPVYDALDNQNNKQAIKLVDSILKKQKDLHCAKALKALGLVRAGRANESIPLLNDIQESADKLDDSTLQAMTMCYKETKQPEGVVAIYELAVKQTPKNEEFLSHLFMACVRIADHVKQQKAALNLYKVFPKNPYYFWAVMSIVMQALTSTDEKKKNMFLTLAERMVSKFMKEDKIEAEEEVRLYMIILEELGRYDDLLKLLTSDFGEKLRCVLNEKTDKEIEYMTILNRWSDVNLKYKSAINNHPDQWCYYKGFLHSCMKLHKDNYAPDIPIDTENIQPDFKPEDAMAFLKDIAEENLLLRGPRLAILELNKLLLENGEGSADVMLQELQNYFDRFGSKPCCFSDMRAYTESFDDDYKVKLKDNLYERIVQAPDDASIKEKINQLMQEICVECLGRQMKIYDRTLSNEEKFDKAQSYMVKYKKSLELGTDLNETERQYGDVLVLLAVYLLMDINKTKADSSMNLFIISYLEEALKHSPSNAQYKLLLFHLYSKLGAYEVCVQQMDDIEIKYIMHDSLGYFLTYGSYDSGSFQSTKRFYDSSLSFYFANQKDTPEQIIASYKYGSFRQVIDISNFKRKVDKSFQFANVMVERLYIDLLRSSNSINETQKVFEEVSNTLSGMTFERLTSEELSDNRDFRLLDNFESKDGALTDTAKKLSFQQYVSWLQLRYLLLRALCTCVSSSSTVNSPVAVANGVTENHSSLHNYIQQIEEIISHTKEYNENTEWENAHDIPPCRMNLFVQKKYHCVILAYLKCYNVLQNGAPNSDLQQINSDLQECNQILKENLTLILSSLSTKHNDTILFNGKCSKNIVQLIEVYSILNVVSMSVKSLTSSSNAKKGKKKKAIADGTDELVSNMHDCSNNINDSLQKLLEALYVVKKDIVDQELNEDDIKRLFEQKNSNVVTEVWHKIEESYKQSLNEIIQVLELKVKFAGILLK